MRDIHSSRLTYTHTHRRTQPILGLCHIVTPCMVTPVTANSVTPHGYAIGYATCGYASYATVTPHSYSTCGYAGYATVTPNSVTTHGYAMYGYAKHGYAT